MKSTKFLILLLAALLAMGLFVACGAPAEDAAAPAGDDAAAAESDAETASTESGAEIAAPIAFTEGEAPGTGEELVTYPLEDLLRYEALDSYQQSPFLDQFVADGTLPAVEERLPSEPMVIPTSGMSSGIGEYGGTWRDFAGVPTEGWNLCAGQTQGWYGINYIYSEALVDSAPTFMRSDAVEPLPNIATGWEWNEDGTELTMELMQGVKWSDGDPFDVEDIMFTWEDNILDANVNSWTSRSTWQIDGEDITLEAVDDYTIKWTFPQPFPVARLFDMDFLDFTICPAHQLKPLHPTYNDEADYESYEAGLPADALPAVTLGPWAAVEYRTDEFMVMRRNPYYWKVDEAGRQLPYLDEVTFEKGESGLGRTLGTLAGSIDHTNLENPSSYVEATRRVQEEDAHFTINWGPEALGFPLEMNLSATLGVDNDRDTALRELFRDLRFRQAVSYALDRDGIAQTVIRGPFLRGFPGGLVPGASEWDIDSVVYYPYDVASAEALLDELGLEDTDGDGTRNFPSGPLADQNLVIELNTDEAAPATQQVGEAIVALLGEVGIQMNVNVLQGPAGTDAEESGQWEMRVTRTGQEWLTPFTRCTELAPVRNERPRWHRAIEGEDRELLDFEQEMIDIVNEFCLEPDSEARAALMSEYNRLFTENVYNVGTVIGRYGLAMAERFENIPTGAPPFFYHWTWGNVRPEQMWIAPDRQGEAPETRPDTIPVYDN